MRPLDLKNMREFIEMTKLHPRAALCVGSDWAWMHEKTHQDRAAALYAACVTAVHASEKLSMGEVVFEEFPNSAMHTLDLLLDCGKGMSLSERMLSELLGVYKNTRRFADSQFRGMLYEKIRPNERVELRERAGSNGAT